MMSCPKTLPRMLCPAWRLADADREQSRPCDALGEPTPQRPLETWNGTYWLCAQTGQLERDDKAVSTELYDAFYEELLASGRTFDDRRDDFARQLGRIARYRQTGRVFEVGCGVGQFLRAARKAGWTAEGNELSPVAADHAQKAAGEGEVSIGSIEKIDLPDEHYDVIMLDNVFEHLQQPMMVMRKLSAALRPGGVMFVQTLQAQSLSMYHAPRDWQYFGPGHSFVPTLVSLNRYFQLSGLKAITLTTHGYRSKARGREQDGTSRPSLTDKLIAGVAARLNLGHRVKCCLQKQ